MVVTGELLPEGGSVVGALASGGSFGGSVQTSATHTNFGVLGEAAANGAGAASIQTSATHKNIGGFSAALNRP